MTSTSLTQHKLRIPDETRDAIEKHLDENPDIFELFKKMPPVTPEYVKKIQENAVAIRAKLAKEKAELLERTISGREYAPESAKSYRKTLEEKKDSKTMQHLKKNISYNPDGTTNFLHPDFKKTFCNDLS
jgi:hypothetical protein